MFLPARNPQESFGLAFLKPSRTKSHLLPITVWKCLPSQRSHFLTRMSLHEGTLNPSNNDQVKNWLPLPLPKPRLELLRRTWGWGRRRRVRRSKTRYCPSLRTPGMSLYPSHSEPSLDSILDSTGCLPEIKYKMHNFFFKRPLGAGKNLARRLLGQEEPYWVSVKHDHHPPPSTHLSPPLSTKD